jgi:large subunit ribosomal protein L2
VTNGQRHRLSLTSFNLNQTKVNSLISGFKKNSGRNIKGYITVRHKVNKTRQRYVYVDFKRKILNQLSVCLNLVKDSNRNAFLALIKYSNGAYSYILAPHGIINGFFLQSITKPQIFSSDYKIGAHVFLKNIESRSIFFNLEIMPNTGGKYARSGGAYCILLSNDVEKNISKIRLPSTKNV